MDPPDVKNKTSLHESDMKFVNETIQVVSNIDGAKDMKLRVNDKLPSTFSAMLMRPPKMSPDDIKQIQMLNTRLRAIRFDFDNNRLILDSWKHKKEPDTRKRQREDDLLTTNTSLSDSYNLDMIDKMDLAHVRGILAYIVESTELEFDVNIHTDVDRYQLILTKMEIFEIKMIEALIKKYGAFVSKISFDFPKSALEICVRRNDSRSNAIGSMLPRKKVKLVE